MLALARARLLLRRLLPFVLRVLFALLRPLLRPLLPFALRVFFALLRPLLVPDLRPLPAPPALRLVAFGRRDACELVLRVRVRRAELEPLRLA